MNDDCLKLTAYLGERDRHDTLLTLSETSRSSQSRSTPASGSMRFCLTSSR